MLPNHPYSHASHRMAPPVRPSRSLEGLERVIPPSPKQPFFPTRSDLFLNKPLPAKPVPDEPAEYSSGMWSDSSDSESDSTVDSLGSPSEPRNSTESYPIFVSSDSDDFMVDHPAPADQLNLGQIRPSPLRVLSSDSRTDSVASGTDVVAEASDAQYGRPSQWTQNRTGTNHYFREKKWDFFPELATPSALQAGGRTSPGIRSGKTRKKEGRLNLAAKRRRWHSLDRAGLGLAYGVRDSIKTYVHRTLSKDSGETKAKESPRPSTAPLDEPDEQTSYACPKTQQSCMDLNMQLRALSVSTASSSLEPPSSPRSIRTQHSSPVQRPNQLAVPMTPYQKYGSAAWETPKKSRRTVHARSSNSDGPSSPDLTYANPTPPLSPPFKRQLQQNTRNAARVLQGGTSHVLVALDGAKRKISESKDERRREALKSQIKLIGPVNPNSHGLCEPWV